MQGRKEPHIAIAGSGFSGLCLGIQLKQAGFDSFTIFEKSDRLGGTWRDNTYPGAACDVPSVSYSFSFEPKPDWSRKWSPQAEILRYMEDCAKKYRLHEHIRFGEDIESARFDEKNARWQLRTQKHEEFFADVFVCGVGQLQKPNSPDLPGLDDFTGPHFHSARWNHDVELRGKNVIVVGNAASAVQFIPQIAPEVSRLTILQRSANWMIPRGDRAFTEGEKQFFARYPLVQKLYRWLTWMRFELLFFPVMRKGGMLGRRIEDAAGKFIRETVDDTKLHEVLIPTYPPGAKRILVADDYYEALNRQNVELVTRPIDHFEEGGVVTQDGTRYPGDVVILATGFETNTFLAPMEIEGAGGGTLADAWSDGARAYMGLTHPGFPNFFMMYGPNTNLGHNSIIFMIECQARYILQCVERMTARDLALFDLLPEPMARFNEQLEQQLERSVWSQVENSWYRLQNGRITNNWSGTTLAYWWLTRRPDFQAYREVARDAFPRATPDR